MLNSLMRPIVVLALFFSITAQAVPSSSATPSVDAQVRASVLTAFVAGRLQRFARSGFRRLPSEHLDASLALVL